MVLMTPDVNIIVLDLKGTKQNEVVTENEDGSYTVFLNARLTHERRLEAYEHAMRHIMDDDFKKTDVQEIETVAHKAKPATDPVSVPDSSVTVAENIKQPTTKRRKRKRNRKQKRYMMDRAEFIMEHCDSFALAEHQYLYGSDL